MEMKVPKIIYYSILQSNSNNWFNFHSVNLIQNAKSCMELRHLNVCVQLIIQWFIRMAAASELR